MQILSKKGFTLIELLVVVAIIGILSSTVMVSLNSARAKANAAKATADISQMMQAMEMAISDGCTNLTYAAGASMACTAPAATYIQRMPAAPSGYGTYTVVPLSPFNPSTTAYTVTAPSGFTDGGVSFTCTGGSCYCTGGANLCKQ